jgi:hypothetical protein
MADKYEGGAFDQDNWTKACGLRDDDLEKESDELIT